MRAAAALSLVLGLTACMDPGSPETLAGQRLEVGDQRLIGQITLMIHGPPYAVIGVKCEEPGFPIQLMDLSRDPEIAKREVAFAVAFNQAMVRNPYYSAAECRAIGTASEVHLADAIDDRTGEAPLPPTESFEQIFGFAAPDA